MGILTISDFKDLGMVADEPEVCRGLIFRCEQTAWIGSQKDINFKERYRFQARMSCPSCSKCDWLWDDISERLVDHGRWGMDSVDRNGEDGKLYELKVTGWSTDHETGHADDWDVGFVLKENT